MTINDDVMPVGDDVNVWAGDDVPYDDVMPSPEFAENPERRCACVILADVSYSMEGSKITQLNVGLATLAEELKKDVTASLRVEVAVVTFSTGAEVVQDFVSAKDFSAPTLEVNSSTHMGAGINLALDIIDSRKNEYKQNSVDYYRPWLFLITDGEPTDRVEQASERLKQVHHAKGVSAFSVGVEGANMEKLREISPRAPLMLKGLNFQEMFQWLSRSLTTVSKSRPDEEPRLETDAISQWGHP